MVKNMLNPVIYNTTPHDVVLIGEDEKPLKVFPKADNPLRLNEKSVLVRNITDKIRLYRKVFGELNYQKK